MNAAALDAHIEAIDEALRVRREITHLRAALLDHEAKADSARLRIAQLRRTASGLSAKLSGVSNAS